MILGLILYSFQFLRHSQAIQVLHESQATLSPTLLPSDPVNSVELLKINREAATLVGYLAIVEAQERSAVIGQVIGGLEHLEAQAMSVDSPWATLQAAAIRGMRAGLEQVRWGGKADLLVQASRSNAALRTALETGFEKGDVTLLTGGQNDPAR